jgi:hypothetical protein
MNLMIVGVIIAIVFLYSVWRGLRHSYEGSKLIIAGWLGIVAFLVLGRLIYGLIHVGIWNESPMDWILFWKKPGISLVGGFLGATAVIAWYAYNKGWKVWTFLEDGLEVWLMSGLMLILLSFLKTKDIKTGVMIVILGLIWRWSVWIRCKYRSFAWYKSGKKGFGWFFVNFWWWLTLAGWFWWTKGVTVEAGISLILSLISGAGLIMLGRVF